MSSAPVVLHRQTEHSLGARIMKNKVSYALLAPYFILFTLFTILPVLISMFFSLTHFDMHTAPQFIGWGNYARLLLDDDLFIIALRNTLTLAVITGPVSYVLCVLFAWIINEFRGWVRATMTLVFYAPSISGQAFLIWSIILTGDRYGLLNGFLMQFGFIQEAILWMQTERYVLPVLIIVQLWLSLGTGFLAFIAGLQTVDKTLYEAAAIDGVKNRWQELWFITLPAIKPQLMFGAIMQITASFAIADVALALAGNPSVNDSGATIVTHLLDFGGIRFEMGYASAIATVLFAMMIGTNMVVQKLLRRVGD